MTLPLRIGLTWSTILPATVLLTSASFGRISRSMFLTRRVRKRSLTTYTVAGFLSTRRYQIWMPALMRWPLRPSSWPLNGLNAIHRRRKVKGRRESANRAMNTECLSENTVSLPGGLMLQHEQLLSTACLRPLSGREEEWLARHRSSPGAVRVSWLLNSCLLMRG